MDRLKAFGEIFGKYYDTAACPTLSATDIWEIKISDDRDIMQVKLMPERIIPNKELRAAKDSVCLALELKALKLDYSYNEELLSGEYLPEIINELIAQGEPINGFFHGAAAVLRDGAFWIDLKNGGVDFLLEQGIDEKISNVL
ncbi:MAG: hypothetical protein RRY54_03985, partial [Angelakisella sp.]